MNSRHEAKVTARVGKLPRNRFFGPWPLGRFNARLQRVRRSRVKAAVRTVFCRCGGAAASPHPRRLHRSTGWIKKPWRTLGWLASAIESAQRSLRSGTVCLAWLLLSFSADTFAGDASTRATFLKLIERPKVPLAPKISELPQTNGLLRFHFTYAADAQQRVPGILIKGASRGRRPVIISLHGTGGAKESQVAFLTNAVSKGFIGVAIDGRYHGERTQQGKGAAAYHEAILRAYQTGQEHPFLYDTVWDILRLIDYLETRDDVDAGRIGVIGFSKGGMETYLAAAVEPRIAVAVPCIGVQSFRWALEHDAWKSRMETIQPAVNAAAQEAGLELPDAEIVRKFYDRVVPGIYGPFDGPAMLPLIAPRPLLVINGEIDPRTPLPGVEECAAATRKAYAAQGAEEKFVLRIQKQTAHKVNPDSLQAAMEWFEKWLKATGEREK